MPDGQGSGDAVPAPAHDLARGTQDARLRIDRSKIKSAHAKELEMLGLVSFCDGRAGFPALILSMASSSVWKGFV